MPQLPFARSISERYIELYEQITGESFETQHTQDILTDIEQNILKALKHFD